MFFINLDNDYLLSSIKDSPNDIELNNIIFKIGVALMSWRNLEALKNNDNYNQIEETINRVNDLGPIIIPLMRQHSRIKVSPEITNIAA
tara:strand:+ start:2731 stop:2997 length:267 start_codon:yes stop_codon:yes gene_type:complete